MIKAQKSRPVTYGETIPFKFKSWLKMSFTLGRVELRKSKTEQIKVVSQ